MDDTLSNVDIVLYALYKLGGVQKKIHTEHIAIEAYKISEDRFSWVLAEYRKYPDKTTVRYALESAKKLHFVYGRAGKDKSGRESEGWQFTPLGVDWFLKNKQRIESCISSQEPISTSLPRHQAERFIRQIQKERLYQLFQENNIGNANIFDLADLLKCSPDAGPEIMKRKFVLLKNLAYEINDKKIRLFIDECEKVFREILLGQKGD